MFIFPLDYLSFELKINIKPITNKVHNQYVPMPSFFLLYFGLVQTIIRGTVITTYNYWVHMVLMDHNIWTACMFFPYGKVSILWNNVQVSTCMSTIFSYSGVLWE